MLLANCEDAYGFPPYTQIETYMLGRNGDDLRGKEKEIILRALKTFPPRCSRATTTGGPTPSAPKSRATRR